MRKHFHTISSLSQSNDPNKDKQIISYISSIEKGLESTNTFINTGNTLFDNIVCRYCSQTTNLKISTKIELLVPPLSFIDAVDLCSILGNMWENAIEACIKAIDNTVEPFIIFRTFVNANHFIMELTNTSITPPAENFKSSKKSPGHGLGIKSIKKLTKKYHGICDFDASEKVFTSRVAIPVNTVSAESIDQCVVLNWRNEI
ncbi:MAG: sensor histidine kinase [Oscillospiraceae bacterium]|nr:sensor histidine kinase [Oscillospiraceae bacterium]